MKKAKVIGIVLLCCAVIIPTFLYITFVYMRTPEYVHKYLTPRYEKEAEDYFYANKDELEQLSALKDTLGVDERYYYAFYEHVFNTPNVPEEILEILLALEEKTDAQYTLYISQYKVTVSIASGTNYDVYLFYGDPEELHGMDPESEKETTLEAGWTVQAAHVVRW